MLSSWREQQARVVACEATCFYPRLVAYGYFWLSEGAYREMGDSVPKHAGPISLTDRQPRTEHLQNPTAS
jgi:hypothetical protein